MAYINEFQELSTGITRQPSWQRRAGFTWCNLLGFLFAAFERSCSCSCINEANAFKLWFSIFLLFSLYSSWQGKCPFSMSIAKNEYKSAVLWYMNGIVATFYESEDQDQKKKVLVDTISFTSKAYLAFRKISSLVSDGKYKTKLWIASDRHWKFLAHRFSRSALFGKVVITVTTK